MEERLLHEMHLARIADMWEYRCTVKHNKRVAEVHRRKDERKMKADQLQNFQDKYFDPWNKELQALHHDLARLHNEWEAGKDVTPADWDAITAGRERKAIHIVSEHFPKESWPLPVRNRFPNLIALFKYEWEVLLLDSRQKQCTMIVKNIIDTFNQTEFSDHKKRYDDVVKHFAEQDTITSELKRLADGIYVSWRARMSVEEFELIEQARVKLNSTRNCSEIYQARSYPNVDWMLFDHLWYEHVMDRNFNAHAWARKIYSQQDMSDTSEARQRAAQMVQPWAKYWQTTPGHGAVVSGANHVTPESSQAHGFDMPLDVTHLYDECEPTCSIDIDKTSNIEYEHELFVPVEPVRDQFGMDLDDDTEHAGEYFLPFDT